MRLTVDTEEKLFRAYAAGDKRAGDKLLLAHRPLARSIAREMRNRDHDIEDLQQEAFVGLAQALEKFDLSEGVRFETYARWWARAAVKLYLLKNHSLLTVPSSNEQKRLFYNLRKAKTRLGIYTSGELRPSEVALVAEDLSVSPEDVVTMNRILAPDYVTSAHVPSGLESGQMKIDLFVDPETEGNLTEQRLHDAYMTRKILNAMAKLKPQEREAIERRVLDEETLAEAGKKMGVSGERVRVLVKTAMEKISADLRPHNSAAA